MASFATFLLTVGTDASFIPALYVVAEHRRHFVLFIGIFQLFSSLMFNLCNSFGVKLFLTDLDWHFISDVTTLTYLCCLLVHCMCHDNETHNIVARYVAFAGAWVCKLHDGWGSAYFEAMLVASYVVAVMAMLTMNQHKLAKFKRLHIFKGIGCALFSGFFLLLQSALGPADKLRVCLSVAHVSGGAGAYFLWKGIPLFDAKKTDARQNLSGFV
jgi:hypothetical protein